LGVILYRLLTGELPFRGNTRMLLHQVLHEEPRPPRKLNDHIPRDVQTICLKCLEKEPSRRYASALDLASDLGRWLAGEPISARSSGLLEKAWKWTRRNPVVASLSTATALALLTGVLGIVWQWRRAVANYEEMRIHRKIAEANYKDAEDQRKIADAKTAEARAKADELERQSYVSLLALSQRETEANNIQLSDRLLERTPARLRGWEWHYCKRVNHRELSTIRRTTDPFFIKEAALSADGRRLACSAGKVAWICDLEGHEQAAMKGHSDVIDAIAWSPDGKTVATGGRDHVIHLWDAQTGAERACLRGHGTWVGALCFSPDGARLLAGTGAPVLTPGACAEVKLWGVADGRLVRTLMETAEGRILSVAYSSDGRRVAAGHSGDVHVWDVDTGAQLGVFGPGQGEMTGVSLSPDGGTLAAGSEVGGILLWDLKTGSLAHSVRGHSGQACVRFSPDGRRLASGGDEGVVRLWDPMTGRAHATLRGHYRGLIRPQFDPKGTQLITASLDGTVRTWDATLENVPPVLIGHTGWLCGASFHPDGRTVATGGWGGILIWEAASGRRLREIAPVHDGGPRAIAYSPDGRRIAAVGLGPLAQVWDAETGRKALAIDTGARGVNAVVFSPDSSTLITGDDDGFVCTWHLTSAGELRRFRAHHDAIICLSLSRDGRKIATATLGATVKIWGLPDGLATLTIESSRSSRNPCGQIATFDAIGGRLAIVRPNYSVAVIDAEGGSNLCTLLGHSAQVNAIAFSPDGRRLATGGNDRTIRLWDLDWGDEVLILRGHEGAITGLAWSRDGRFLASTATDRTGRIWDAGPRTGPYNPTDPDRRPVARSRGFDVKPDGKNGIRWIVSALDGRTIAMGSGGDIKLRDPVSNATRGLHGRF
jgi:WD40 repeat protein